MENDDYAVDHRGNRKIKVVDYDFTVISSRHGACIWYKTDNVTIKLENRFTKKKKNGDLLLMFFFQCIRIVKLVNYVSTYLVKNYSVQYAFFVFFSMTAWRVELLRFFFFFQTNTLTTGTVSAT